MASGLKIVEAGTDYPLLSNIPDAHDVHTPSRTPKIIMWGVFVTLAGVFQYTPNGLLTSAAILLLPIMVALLWRRAEPPVLLFACAFQWLQASAAIFYTNNLGLTLSQAFGSHELSVATLLSLCAVLALALGMRCGLLGRPPLDARDLEANAARIDINKLGMIYCVSVVVSAVLTYAGAYFSNIRQPLLGIASLKWGIVFMLCYTVFYQRRGYGFLCFCVATEFVLGFTGIYASFKWVFFVLVFAAMSSSRLFRGGRIVVISVCFLILFFLGIVWSAVKMDYRTFLFEEEAAGADAGVPMERKFTKLADLVESLNFDNIGDGLDALILRVSYVNFFALTIENVPNRIPYENGELWKGAVIHALTPRVLFPDKPILDDSERTRLYTGVNVAGMEENTSIGIGYVGESYIDFGPIGMFAPIFCLGIVYGLIYRFLITRTLNKLLGTALGLAVIVFNAYAIETSNIKLFGGVLTAAIAATLFSKVIGPTFMALASRDTPMKSTSRPWS